MNYGEAIEAVKRGDRVTRGAWLEADGSEMCGRTKALMLVTGAEAPYRAIGRITIEPFVAQYVIGGRVSAYQPTHEDKTAKDWKIICKKI